jgi:hypothetical protein
MIMQIKATQDGKVSHKLIANSIPTTGDMMAPAWSSRTPPGWSRSNLSREP